MVRFRYVGLTTQVAASVDEDDSGHPIISRVANGWSGDRLFEWAGSTEAFFGTNGHRDVTWTADSVGEVSGTLRYDPYGNLDASTGSYLPAFRYQGSWLDSSAGLAWVVTRWYAPTLGRFLTEDSLLGDLLDPADRHLYIYGHGDPIVELDPNGHTACEWDDCRTTSGSTPLAKALARYDDILVFIRNEMETNARGSLFGKWTTGTRFCYQLGPCSNPIMLPSDVANNTKVLADFGILVRPGGDWDHKKRLRDRYLVNARDLYTPIRGDSVSERIYYDIWSNIHYGYVGRSHGIPSDILFTAPVFADGSNTDADNASVEIGMTLWANDRFAIGGIDIQRAVLNQLARYRQTPDEVRNGYY